MPQKGRNDIAAAAEGSAAVPDQDGGNPGASKFLVVLDLGPSHLGTACGQVGTSSQGVVEQVPRLGIQGNQVDRCQRPPHWDQPDRGIQVQPARQPGCGDGHRLLRLLNAPAMPLPFDLGTIRIGLPAFAGVGIGVGDDRDLVDLALGESPRLENRLTRQQFEVQSETSSRTSLAVNWAVNGVSRRASRGKGLEPRLGQGADEVDRGNANAFGGQCSSPAAKVERLFRDTEDAAR